MSDTARMFLAFDVGEETREGLKECAWRIAGRFPGTKWVRRDALHVTLRFLGDTELDCVSDIQAAMESGAIGCAPFSCTARGLGVFPNERRPTVVWAGIGHGRDRLMGLGDAVRQALTDAGFGSDARPFSPHITLGRVRHGARVDQQSVTRTLDGWQEREFGTFSICQVTLYRSTLTGQGPVYDVLRSVTLDTGSGG